eukprot:13299252-Ditylum_brightwellii.AAC.1
MVMLPQQQAKQMEEDKAARDYQLNLACVDMEQQERAREARRIDHDCHHSNTMMMMGGNNT